MARKMYVYYQPNRKDLKDSVGDCAIRAMCKALGKSWLEVFDDLTPYAREAQCLFNQKPAYEPYLKDSGFTYSSVKRGTTVKDFRKSFKGTAICYVRAGYGTHLVAVVGGQYFDTWDSGDCYMFGYYERSAS